MEIDLTSILSYLGTFLLGGGVGYTIKFNNNKKKSVTKNKINTNGPNSPVYANKGNVKVGETKK